MKHAETVTLGSSGLDRAEDFRRDPDAIAAMRPSARFLPFWRGKPLVNAAKDALSYTTLETLPEGTEVFLGRDEAGPIFARDVSCLAVEDGDAETLGGFHDHSEQYDARFDPGAVFAELRRAMTWLTPRDAELAAMGRAVLEWHRTHQFCANCGAPTVVTKAGFQRSCGSCGRQHFPRTDPVVIMLITHGNDVLMGRSHGWPEGMYSLLAGFIDPAETMEAAVRREVWEEAGVRVGAVSYLASQPWPFPASLMFGCAGEALSAEITVDTDEIEDARWISKERMLHILNNKDVEITSARPGSIARFLIENWVADTLN